MDKIAIWQMLRIRTKMCQNDYGFVNVLSQSIYPFPLKAVLGKNLCLLGCSDKAENRWGPGGLITPVYDFEGLAEAEGRLEGFTSEVVPVLARSKTIRGSRY